MEIQITTTKTTNIIFEYSILSIDRGSEFLLAQRASRIRNVIQVKAGIANLEPTNLTVITSDGKLHSLLISYHPNPDKLVYHIGETSQWPTQFEEGYHNEKKLQLGVKRSLAKMNYERLEKQRRMGITFSLEAIYATENFLWFRFTISNHTRVNYSLEDIRFFIEDTNKIKRSTYQQIELFPIHSYTDLNKIPPMAVVRGLQVLPLKILPKGKQLSVQLTEDNGSRPLELKIKNNQLIHAKPL